MQQIASRAQDAIAEVQHDVKLDEVSVIKVLNVLVPNFSAQRYEVVILKVPIIQDEIFKGAICHVNFSLQFYQTESKVDVLLQ